MDPRPVLYLDLDDTVISWSGGHPRAARGGREFVLWALEHYEVRWLTTWCPSGEMEAGLLSDLAKMLEIPAQRLGRIAGGDWADSRCKLDGIAWLEHLVLGRPFLWIEDEKGVRERELAFLREHGLLHHYRHCNVTRDEQALEQLHQELLAASAPEAGADAA